MGGDAKQPLVMDANVKWVPSGASGIKWNIVGIGGNDFWRDDRYTNEDRHQEWYAIDDVLIASEIPSYLTNDVGDRAAPNPPTSISVE